MTVDQYSRALRTAQGKPISEVVRLQNEVTGEPLENPVTRCLREGRVVALADNAVLLGHGDTPIAIQDSAAPIQDRLGNVVGAVMVFHDVSQERQLHRKLSYHASHDSLTGLINRREFERRLLKDDWPKTLDQMERLKSR